MAAAWDLVSGATALLFLVKAAGFWVAVVGGVTGAFTGTIGFGWFGWVRSNSASDNLPLSYNAKASKYCWALGNKVLLG